MIYIFQFRLKAQDVENKMKFPPYTFKLLIMTCIAVGSQNETNEILEDVLESY